VSINATIASNEKASAPIIIEALVNAGWNPIVNGSINYLPINDNDLYNWTSSKFSINHLLEIIKRKEQNNETIGVELYWKETNVGVSLLIINSNELSFSIEINKKYIDESAYLIDFNWYSKKIIPILCELYHINKYSFEYFY
jgi:hypothetical protein